MCSAFQGVLFYLVALQKATCSASQTVVRVSNVLKKHAAIIPNILAVHALTWCDSMSLMAGIGEAMVSQKVTVAFTYTQPWRPTCFKGGNYRLLHGLHALALRPRARCITERLACQHLFKQNCRKTPHTSKTVKSTTYQSQHCLRAHYQSVVWIFAGMPSPPADLNPLDCGWEMQGATLIAIRKTFRTISSSRRSSRPCHLPLPNRMQHSPLHIQSNVCWRARFCVTAKVMQHAEILWLWEFWKKFKFASSKETLWVSWKFMLWSLCSFVSFTFCDTKRAHLVNWKPGNVLLIHNIYQNHQTLCKLCIFSDAGDTTEPINLNL